MSTIRMVAWGISEVARMDKHTFQCVRIQIRKELKPYRLRLTHSYGDNFTLRRLENKHRSKKVYAGTLQNVCIAALATIEPEGNYKPPPEEPQNKTNDRCRRDMVWLDELLESCNPKR